MALTRNVLTANAILTGLSDEQISAIVTLSQNDESSVIGARIGELYRQLDETIANSTGIARDGDEKTYKYLERAAKALNEKAAKSGELEKQVGELTKEKSRLEKALADGTGDEETKKALSQAQKDLAAVRKQYNELNTQYEADKARHASELLGVKIDNELSAAVSGVQFKKELPPTVTRVILDQTIAKVKGMQPEYIDNGTGGKVLVFKDDTGAIRRNPHNQLNPYTAAELINEELKTMGVLYEGRQQQGAGSTGGHTGGGKGGNSIDVSGAKSRTEAYNLIADALMAQGMTNGSDEFETAMQQAWKDNNISALPEQ